MAHSGRPFRSSPLTKSPFCHTFCFLMSIEAIAGSVGGGKTYFAIDVLLHRIAADCTVATNIKVYRDEIAKQVKWRYGYTMDPDQLIELSEEQAANFHRFTPPGTAEAHSLAIIDEAHFAMPAGESLHARNANEALRFASTSRHSHTDLIFISQSMDNVDIKIRRLVTNWYFVKDLRQWKFPKIPLKYPFPHQLRLLLDRDGKTELSRTLHVWDKDLFKCFDSFQTISSFDRAKSTIAKGKKKGTTFADMKTLSVHSFLFLILFGWTWHEHRQNQKQNVRLTHIPKGGSQIAGTTTNTPAAITGEIINGVLTYTCPWSAWGNGYAFTSTGLYQIGQLSANGQVIQISNYDIRCIRPDGQKVQILRAPYSYKPPIRNPAPPTPPAPPAIAKALKL